MDEWLSPLAGETTLSSSEWRHLLTDGFVVVPGPVPDYELQGLSRAYDQAVSQAEAVDFSANERGWPMVGFILAIDDFRPELRPMPGSCVSSPGCDFILPHRTVA